MVDKLAKEAAALDQAEAPFNQATAETLISRRVKKTYLNYELKDKASLKIMEKHPPDHRKERIVLSQLRTGKNSHIFNYYLHEIGVIDDSNSKDCPRELDDMKHVLLHCSKLNEEKKKKHLGPRPTVKLIIII
ncbi:hypothetical protein ElyMa_002225900 [Elysia marginata]|uniref:Reverse transcriptase zinc-binding domain-containing protein n=1 Tax=Elysia marginata TaxID=1093978 RepID=A0AAV4FUA5_9GAST|nr:hypothetical protein ElyMa_002225900 [Elysia marginata]